MNITKRFYGSHKESGSIERHVDIGRIMRNSSEDKTLNFLKSLGFPGIRKGERNDEVCSYLSENGYKYTPDLVAGPQNIREAEIGGLFFIDVITPTSDMLFVSKYYKGYKINIPKIFQEKLDATSNNGKSFFIDEIPNDHQEFYLDSLNNKLDKYAHQRKFKKGEKLFVSANFGIVHYFDLGELINNSISEFKNLITVLDYIRFYKRLAPSNNIDLKNAENLLLKEIVNEKQEEPFILAVGRELADLPCLFFMLHMTIMKQTKRKHIALFVLNTPHLDNSDGKYPVHTWFKSRIFHLKSEKYLNSEYEETKVLLNINPSVKLFE